MYKTENVNCSIYLILKCEELRSIMIMVFRIFERRCVLIRQSIKEFLRSGLLYSLSGKNQGRKSSII